MLSLFKRKQNNEVVVTPPVEKAVVKGKTTNEIIEEIHESFYTEVDRLLVDAKIMKSLDTTKQDLIDKCARLKLLGFTNTKEVQEAELEIKRLNDLETENRNKNSLIEAINYFSQKYPCYKFITEDSVKKICAKYNLVYSTIDRYTGTVPDINLKHMENFKIDIEDVCWEEITSYVFGDTEVKLIPYKLTKEYKISTYKASSDYTFNKYDMLVSDVLISYNGHVYEQKCPLEICAPLKDFNIEKSELNDFKLSTKVEIPDPVVLQPVFYGGQKHFLIVTAWGIEASDELVVNQKMN